MHRRFTRLSVRWLGGDTDQGRRGTRRRDHSRPRLAIGHAAIIKTMSMPAPKNAMSRGIDDENSGGLDYSRPVHHATAVDVVDTHRPGAAVVCWSRRRRRLSGRAGRRPGGLVGADIVAPDEDDGGR